jgi:hypothetical protein
MPTHMKRVGKKRTHRTEGLLESAAQAIGSTLGAIALKTGLASPTRVRAVKKSPARKTAPKSVKVAAAKRVPRKSA